MESSLLQRKDIRVDPYRQGFGHLDNTANIDLNAVRLCFQVSERTQNHELGRTTFLSICRWSCVSFMGVHCWCISPKTSGTLALMLRQITIHTLNKSTFENFGNHVLFWKLRKVETDHLTIHKLLLPCLIFLGKPGTSHRRHPSLEMAAPLLVSSVFSSLSPKRKESWQW